MDQQGAIDSDPAKYGNDSTFLLELACRMKKLILFGDTAAAIDMPFKPISNLVKLGSHQPLL